MSAMFNNRPVRQSGRFRVSQGRRCPKSARIAAAILENEAILNLHSRRLVKDIVARFHCRSSTALTAIAIARDYA
jgi:hypothetical protein